MKRPKHFEGYNYDEPAVPIVVSSLAVIGIAGAIMTGLIEADQANAEPSGTTITIDVQPGPLSVSTTGEVSDQRHAGEITSFVIDITSQDNVYTLSVS